MAKKHLVIVESPAKAKTIQKYLGKGYDVIASMGHIRDLPKSKLGVDVENGFQPQYTDMKGKARRFPYSGGGIHLLSGDSGNVRGKPAEAGEVRTALYRHGNDDAADRYDLRVCGFHCGDSFPDELHQEA